MLTNRNTRSPQQAQTATTAPRGASPGANALLTIIDRSLSIIGDLQSQGELQVKGRVQGNIHCQSIVVDQDGAIEGGILADRVLIHGRTKGFIRATHIELGATAIVESDLFHATLIVHDGALFEGMSETNKSQKHTEMQTDMQVDELRAMVDRMKTDAQDAAATAHLQPGSGLARRA